MGVRILEGSTSSHYVLDDYFSAIAVIGEEQDAVSFVGFYRGDYDLVELQVDPYTRAMRQVTLTGCRHYSVLDEPMIIPRARDGIVAVDMVPQNDCDALRVTCYCDGVLVRVLDELPTDYVCCGSVIFGVTGAGELASIRLASMTPEEAAHARSVLMGEGLEGDFEPMENEATMYTVKLENEFLRGAVWVLGEDGITTEGKLPLVEADPVVLELNEEIAEMYDSYFEFDSHDQGCWFNEAQRKADRDKMLSLLARLRVRLEEINDGSFTVVDYETPSLLSL